MEKDIHTVSCETCNEPALFGMDSDGNTYAVCSKCRLATPSDDMLVLVAMKLLASLNTSHTQ